MDSRAFYDSWVDRQLRVGVNARHRAILRYLREWGMRRGDRVLEIGAGVGTVTGLVAEELGGRGEIVAVDLSPRSIEAARERLEGFGNVTLLVGDVLEMELDGAFDVIVLPDVIEHIPLEHHPALFERLARWTGPGGFVLLHYPAPLYQEWLREHRPELLQHVDQPVHADGLTAAAYPHGLLLEHLETYSIWMGEGDYQVARLRPRPSSPTFTPVARSPGLVERVKGVVGRWLG